MNEKAYKLLAVQEGISNRAAKDLIDRGVVYSGGKKVTVARGEISSKANFKIEKIAKPKIIFQDKKIIAVDKPAFMTTEEVARNYAEFTLLHRLDKETSGVLLFTKDDAFHEEAVQAFRKREVEKEYIAVVQGKCVEAVTIDDPIITIKKGSSLFSKIASEGKDAITHVEPLMLEGKISKVKVTIETGRTHQIRAHLKSIKMPIVGDTQYGARPYKRVMLHAHKIALLGYSFESKEPGEFAKIMNMG
ncbi:RluA family pseudouridine synthase [Sulfurospirillum arcachonense]|uniref:RluA family pseudouridine synthase n=1 Tax=Sulfurospirillum arcachonense TaxID=57666 RepID=UPI00046A71D5|nr:RluA family pseudouridine synthase [Sulfurospirillum arcachonense]